MYEYIMREREREGDIVEIKSVTTAGLMASDCRASIHECSLLPEDVGHVI